MKFHLIAVVPPIPPAPPSALPWALSQAKTSFISGPLTLDCRPLANETRLPERHPRFHGSTHVRAVAPSQKAWWDGRGASTMADGQVEVEEATARNRATPEPPPYRTANNLDGSGRRPQNLALGAWTGGAGANPHDSSSSSVLTFLARGKVTPWLTWQNEAMSSSDPGSWPPNSFEGKPRTSRPRSW